MRGDGGRDARHSLGRRLYVGYRHSGDRHGEGQSNVRVLLDGRGGCVGCAELLLLAPLGPPILKPHLSEGRERKGGNRITRVDCISSQGRDLGVCLWLEK